MSLESHRPVDRVTTFARAMARLYRERDIPFMAGSVAYSAFVSLLPMALLLLIAASILGGEALEEYVLDLTGEYLTPSTQAVLRESMTESPGRFGFSVFGFVALLWAVLKVFRSLDKAFSKLYGAPAAEGIVENLADGAVVLGSMTVAIMGMIVVGTFFSRIPAIPFATTLSFAGLVVGLAVVFLPIYYVFPGPDVTLREVVPGALVAAIGWTALQGIFQVYVSMTSTNRLYGVIGGVILILTWLYLGAVVLLLGASTNVVLAGRDRETVGATR